MLLCACHQPLDVLLAAVLMAIGIGGSQPAIQATGKPSGKRQRQRNLYDGPTGFIVGPMGGGYRFEDRF